MVPPDRTAPRPGRNRVSVEIIVHQWLCRAVFRVPSGLQFIAGHTLPLRPLWKVERQRTVPYLTWKVRTDAHKPRGICSAACAGR